MSRLAVRLVAATVAGLAALSGSLGTAAAAGPADSARRLHSAASVLPSAAGDTGLELKLTKVSPAAAGPDDEVVVTGTVRNLGTTAVKNTRVSLWLRPEVLPDREAIDTWLADGTLTPADRQLPVVAVIRSLAPGATDDFRLEVSPGQTGLYSSSGFGPRAIALQARGGGRRLASLRSTLVWAPTEITTPTRLSVIVPITSATPSTHAGEATAAAAADLMGDGRLRRVLEAAHDDGMAWAIDPAVLTAAQRLADDGIDREPDDAALTAPASTDPDQPSPTADSTAAGESPEIEDAAAMAAARDWLSLFETERRDRGLFGLPYADPDLAAVLKTTKGMPLLRTSDALGKDATAKVLGGPIDTTLAWPADGRINAATTRALVRLKRTSVILAESSQKPDPELDYTPTGRSTVRSSAGSLNGLLYDEQLSSLISSTAGRTPAATQTLLAQLAAITMEQPGTGRHLLAVTPRNWSPDPTAVQNMMDALGSAGPWLSLRGISELQKASGPPRSAPVFGSRAAKAMVPIGSVSAAQVMDKGLTAFAPILLDPAPVQPLRERVASLLSVAWRQGDDNQLVAARIDVAADVNNLVGGVKLVTSSVYTFTARETVIPVTLSNETNYEVRVVVQLKPQSRQLTFDKSQTVTVAAKQSTPVLVNATAVTGGDVVVEGKLLGPSGVALGPGVNFIVRVRPTWERWGMIGAGSVLGFLLLIGLLRGVRRNRTRVRVPIEAVPDVDELAVRRAAEAESAETAEAAGTQPEMAAARSGSAVAGPHPPSARPAGPTSALPPVFIPPGTGPRPAAEPDPEPVPDPVPVPITMPDPEPDPKARGGPVDSDGVRLPVEQRVDQ